MSTSTEKLKVIKNIKGVDSYSKNPIIDSLIKQKLSAQMISVKGNFQQFIKQAQSKNRPQSQMRPIIKRTQSVQQLAKLTPDRIRQSISYNPTVQSQTINFVTQRQSSSPLYDNNHIQELNKARTNNQDFFVKMRQSDRYSLDTLHHQDPKYYKNLEIKAKDKLPENLWLPQLPQVSQIIENKTERLSVDYNNKSRLFNLSITNRPPSGQFTPLRSNRKISTGYQEMTYDFKRYHKSDYQSLEKWLEIAVTFVNQKHINQQKGGETQQKEHLNQIYSIYICAIKQLIRLTYIQSAEKGLILEKVAWSMIRLFQELIRQQHRLNFSDFKYFNGQSKEERQMFQQRMHKLQDKLNEYEQEFHTLRQEKKKIVLTGITYKKVNEEMHRELNILLDEIRSVKSQNDYLNSNLLRLIHQFEQRDFIKIQKTEEHNIYFYLDQNDQIRVVAKVPKNEVLQDFFQNEIRKNVLKDTILEGINTNVGKLQNMLSNYWERKKSYLEVDTIVREHFQWSTQDGWSQADGRGPHEYIDMGMQFPQESGESFEQYLKRQLAEERQNWHQKQKQYENNQISLKELYDELKQTIEVLSSRNATLKNTVSQKDFEINFHTKKLEQLQERLALFTKKIAMLEETVANANQTQKNQVAEIEDLTVQLKQEKKKGLYEKENNKLLAHNLFQLKQKSDLLQNKFNQLEEQIKAVAPYLEKTMTLPEASKHLALIDLSAAVQKHLSQYVQKDAKVFLTF